MLTNSGIIVFKYWFSVSRTEQFRRFKSRQNDPLKQWKLSPVDMASLSLWHEYSKAKDAMMFNTDTKDSPWTIVRSDDKKRGRINCLRHFLHQLDYTGKDHEVVTLPDSLIVGSSSEIHEKDEQLKVD
jgi:polyphosphate kinase 2 (PPK2 family)